MNIFNHQQEKADLIVINFARLLFAGLIIFELLNFFKILQFNLQYTWLGLVITAMVLFALLEFIAYKYKRLKGDYLHWSIWLIVTAGLSLDAAGDFFHLYGKYGWWDQMVHFFVSAIICFALFTVISAFWIDKFKFSLLLKTGRLKLSLFLAATSTMSLSALYEIEEYTEDLIFHTNRLGPGTDTANDLVCNFSGILTTVIFVSVYYLITHKRKVVE
ncbi:MAG: hypothetical protein Q8N21_04160 [bacterium]|nr:hypothetical protein [bacterium]